MNFTRFFARGVSVACSRQVRGSEFHQIMQSWLAFGVTRWPWRDRSARGDYLGVDLLTTLSRLSISSRFVESTSQNLEDQSGNCYHTEED